MLYIGIDLGTSSVKLLLMDGAGDVKKIVSREYPLYFPKEGWSEQEPEDWFSQTLDGIKELISGCDKGEISGISFGGQMHGLVVLDSHDRVIRPAILWNDGRTAEEADYLNTVIGKEKLSAYTSNIAFAGFTAPKILWIKKNEPENFEQISKIMLPKDYLVYMMSGVFATDVSDASGMLLVDVKNRRWSSEMLNICGIEEKQLPKIFESYDLVGYLKPELAKVLGVSETVKIIAGAGDNAAAAVGTGTLRNGDCNISVGTSGTICIATEKNCVDENNALHAFAHANGKYYLMGVVMSAASCNKWWCNEVLNTDNYSSEQEKINHLGENKVLFVPYLMGERCPYNDPDVRAAFVGMSFDTTRADMTQAVLEGVAFGFRDCLEIAKKMGIKIEQTTICGGGAKSTLWKRIIANVLNIRIKTVECQEGPALGAAILAAVGCGECISIKDMTNKIVKVTETIEPEPELVEKYERKYGEYTKIYPAIKELYRFNNWRVND